MANLVYSYRDGPFKGLLVRRGYDPEIRENHTSRFYQLLSVRMTSAMFISVHQR